MPLQVESAGDAVSEVLTEFVAGIVAAVPQLLAAVFLLASACLVIRVVLRMARTVFERAYPGREPRYGERFIGLGIAFALREMTADTAADVSLLRDPEFNEGDLVNTASVTGAIVDIDLRKTRLRLRTEDGGLVVLADRDVEKRWTREAPEDGVSPTMSVE